MINPRKLPVYQHRDMIVSALEKYQVIVVESPTGSGKTTQLPVILHEAGYTKYGVVGVTQPRRIAALSVCDFIARQLDVKVSGFVGYKMRFEDKTTLDTRLKIMTDGTLLQEIKGDPLLSQYSVVMVDEAHERSLNIDFILGLLKNALQMRPELKVIISSATINASIFSKYFGDCPVVHIDSQMYPVQVYYEPPSVPDDDEELIRKVVSIVERAVKDNRKGDILIFLAGEKNIKDCMTQLYISQVKKKLFILPLYGRLGKEEQERIFIDAPFGKVKVIVATNIAETSITIDGVTTVIDSGYCKLNYYNPKSFTSSLMETPVSKASAEQRKGRAGRTQAGFCHRVYPVDSFDKRPDFTMEEIYRTDLAEVVLRMAEIGIRDFHAFDFISPPNRKGVTSAIETLLDLDAINSANELTATGKMMVEFPLLPRHSRMIVEAILRYPRVIKDVIIASAFLSTNSPYLLPQGEEIDARRAHHTFLHEAGDFMAYINLYHAFLLAGNKTKFCEQHYIDEKMMHEIVNITEQLEEIVSVRLGVPVLTGGKVEDYLCACARGLIQFVCRCSGRGVYNSPTAEKIIIHPGSVIFRESPPFIVAGEIVRTTKTYARTVSPLKKEWLGQISPILLERFRLTGGGKHHDRHEERMPDQERGKKPQSAFQLFGESFPWGKAQGKSEVQFDWQKLKNSMDNVSEEEWPDMRSIRGALYYKGMEVLNDTKVNMILKVVHVLSPAKDIITGFPKKTYSIENPSHVKELADDVNYVMKITRGGKKKHKGGAGFISLQTDWHGRYWLKAARSFNAAVSESLASLDRLADELASELPNQDLQKINAAYRRLDKLYSL
jgi:HrpA-like RNA helicase